MTNIRVRIGVVKELLLMQQMDIVRFALVAPAEATKMRILLMYQAVKE